MGKKSICSLLVFIANAICVNCRNNTQNTKFEEWWAFTSMYSQVKFWNSCFTSFVLGALHSHSTFYGPSNRGLFWLVYLPCLSQMERERDGFITFSVIPLLGSHAWGQSLEILLKDTLEIYIRTLAPLFNASIVLYRCHTEYSCFHGRQWHAEIYLWDF